MRAQATTHSKVTFLNSSTRGTILGEEAEWLTEDFRMSLLSRPLLERLCVTPQEDAMKEIPKFVDKIKTLYWKYSKARMYQRRSMLLRSNYEERVCTERPRRAGEWGRGFGWGGQSL